MTARATPGKRLRRTLDASLGNDCSWNETELVALDKIAKAEDRAAVLERLFADETAKPPAILSAHKVAEISGELRQTEKQIISLIGTLIPDPDGPAERPKSAQHVAAARTRWDKRSHRRGTA